MNDQEVNMLLKDYENQVLRETATQCLAGYLSSGRKFTVEENGREMTIEEAAILRAKNLLTLLEKETK